MNIAGQSGNHIVLSITRGEELFATLQKFLEDKQIVGGYFSGLGAADRIELAYYNLESREYERQMIEEEVEILSLQGNIAWKEGARGKELVLHMHGVFGRRDLTTFGGHLFALHVSGVCEIHLVTFDQSMARSYDEATGLHTLCQLPS